MFFSVDTFEKELISFNIAVSKLVVLTSSEVFCSILMNRALCGTMNKHLREEHFWQAEKRENMAGGRWSHMRSLNGSVEPAITFQPEAA